MSKTGLSFKLNSLFDIFTEQRLGQLGGSAGQTAHHIENFLQSAALVGVFPP
jgi:hypothetical protein